MITRVGKELQGKGKVPHQELKAEHVLGLKSPFMKIHTLSVYVVLEANWKLHEYKSNCNFNPIFLEGKFICKFLLD